MDATRIADLRRRLEADPTSIAFAQLAEEYRRARQFDQAVVVCREGLQRHSGYLSARITLGRALVELGHVAEAEQEFEYVLRAAPDNLAAIRGLAEIHQKQGNLDEALKYYRRALALAHYDPDLDETVRAIADAVGRSDGSAGDAGLSFEQARQELMAAPSRVPAVTPPKTERVDFDLVLQSVGYAPDAPAPPIGEAWLTAPSTPVPDVPFAEAPLAAEAVVGDDLLAELEHELRQLAGRPPTQGVSDRDHAARTDQVVLAELERWLTAIVRLRADASARQAGPAQA